MKKLLLHLIPGRAQKSIEEAHKRIIELRKQKREFLENSNYSMTSMASFLGPNKEEQILIMDEEIKESEEIIKLWSGKLDPNRKKWFWSILVPVSVSIFTTLVVTYIIKIYLP